MWKTADKQFFGIHIVSLGLLCIGKLGLRGAPKGSICAWKGGFDVYYASVYLEKNALEDLLIMIDTRIYICILEEGRGSRKGKEFRKVLGGIKVG